MGAALRGVESRGRGPRVLQQRLGSVRRPERAVAEATTVVIRPGRLDEGARLKEIAIASKGFWGYEPERVHAWADQGDFSPARLRELIVFVAESDGHAI